MFTILYTRHLPTNIAPGLILNPRFDTKPGAICIYNKINLGGGFWNFWQPIFDIPCYPFLVQKHLIIDKEMPASGLRPAIFNLLEYFPNLWTKLPPYYFYNPALIWQTKNIPLYTEESDKYVVHMFITTNNPCHISSLGLLRKWNIDQCRFKHWCVAQHGVHIYTALCKMSVRYWLSYLTPATHTAGALPTFLIPHKPFDGAAVA